MYLLDSSAVSHWPQPSRYAGCPSADASRTTARSVLLVGLRPFRRNHTVPPHDRSGDDEHGKTQSDERPQDLYANAGEPPRVQREQPCHQEIAGALPHLRTNPEKPAVIAVEMYPRFTHDHPIADDGL